MILLLPINSDAYIIYIIFGAWFIPPIALTVIGLLIRRKRQKAATTLFIIAVIYLIIGAGLCATMMKGLKKMG